MARRVKWSRSALTDLVDISEYIAKDSRFYAAAFVRKVKLASHSLSKMSLRARIVPETQDENIRELLLGNYRMIFRINMTKSRLSRLFINPENSGIN